MMRWRNVRRRRDAAHMDLMFPRNHSARYRLSARSNARAENEGRRQNNRTAHSPLPNVLAKLTLARLATHRESYLLTKLCPYGWLGPVMKTPSHDIGHAGGALRKEILVGLCLGLLLLV